MQNPDFAATPDVQGATVTVANTSTSGATGTFATIFTAAANGSYIDFVKIRGILAIGAIQAADCVRFFVAPPNGALQSLTEVPLVLGTAISLSVLNFEQSVALGIKLPAGWTLQASTHVGGATASYHVTAFGADF